MLLTPNQRHLQCCPHAGSCFPGPCVLLRKIVLLSKAVKPGCDGRRVVLPAALCNTQTPAQMYSLLCLLGLKKDELRPFSDHFSRRSI
jgi:hypothetical protein